MRTVPLKALATYLKSKGIYLIARVVVFKDDLLPRRIRSGRSELGGGLWKDSEGPAWIDPSRREAWTSP